MCPSGLCVPSGFRSGAAALVSAGDPVSSPLRSLTYRLTRKFRRILTIQSFECLNVTAQSLCAAYLGAKNAPEARAVMLRLAALGGGVGSIVGIGMFLAQVPLASIFTKDPAVVKQVLMTMPMVAVFMPLDSLASIMDGSLMAAKQTDYLSAVQIIGAGFQARRGELCDEGN